MGQRINLFISINIDSERFFRELPNLARLFKGLKPHRHSEAVQDYKKVKRP